MTFIVWCKGHSLPLLNNLWYSVLLCCALSSPGKSAVMNSYPNSKNMDWSKLKAFPDDNLNVVQLMKFVNETIENMSRMFSKCLYHRVVNPSPKRRYFVIVQIERVCRRQFQIWWKLQKVLQMGRKHWGKRRNCSLRAISPFPTVFSKDLYCRHVKTRACLGKG